MPVEVIMPKVDMDMASGKVAVWHAAPGERVEKGAPLFDIETDKAAMEVEAPASGILHHPVPEGSEVPIGAAVAWLYAEGEAVGAPPATGAASPPATAPAASVPPIPVAPAVASALSRTLRATPLARKLATEGGVDLAALSGAGPRGRVQAADVRALLDQGRAPVEAPLAGAQNTSGPLSVTRSRGGSGTPLVLLHGFASDALSWAPLEAHLRDRPILRIDLPCHGRSPLRRMTGFAALAAEVRQAFDGLNLDRAHLVGHSLGGALALALADTRPRAVAGLTLIAPAGLGPEINGAALNGICRATRAESLGPWLRALVADEGLVTDSYVRLAMAARADATLRAAQQAMAEVLFPDGTQAFDLRAALHRVEVPARILWGKADAIIPWRHALAAPGRVGLHLFDRIGHMPHIEAAGAVGDIIGRPV